MGIDVGRRSIVAWAAQAPNERGAEFIPAVRRFAVGKPLGEGGMGEVFLVDDKDLRRQIAMKVLREDVADERGHRLHFVAEAQTTSQLDHPGIPPVHDIGVGEEGRPYFTMKLVRGHTLAQVILDLAEGKEEVECTWTLHRLVTIVERVAETLHFAHERGVIHRDLKPENIMLGDYGEIYVMDWGIARVAGETPVPIEGAGERAGDAIDTSRIEAGHRTQQGAVMGTVPYMSPEQLAGAADLDCRTDVYALGCLLYEVLTLEPAFDPGDAAIVEKKLMGTVPDVGERAPQRHVPVALADTCGICMAVDREDRYATASEVADALRAWLDGTSERERRHWEAEHLAMQGGEMVRAYLESKEALALRRQEAAAAAASTKPWHSLDEKRPLLDARRAIKDTERSVALAFAEASKLLDAALLHEEGNATARAALADLWRTRLEEADADGNEADVAFAHTMLERYDDGRLARVVAGLGSLSLRSEPPAQVTLFRYTDRDGILHPEGERPLGTTPVETDLPMGSYLCVLSREGFPDVRYPVFIGRNTHWEGRVRMRAQEDIGDGFLLVPGGPFRYGLGRKLETLDLPDFAIQRSPVTNREYARFMDTLSEENATLRQPRSTTDAPFFTRGEDGHWAPNHDLIHEEPHLSRYRRDFGEDFVGKMPVFGLSWEDAKAYAAWLAEREGARIRLPTDREWEKAARGVDGRLYPWGDLEDATMGLCLTSRDEKSRPAPVGSYPTATSVYGMQDAAGNLWDWTSTWSDVGHNLVVLCGGSWGFELKGMLSGVRLRVVPTFRDTDIGFRLVRELDAPRGE